jgi:transposase
MRPIMDNKSSVYGVDVSKATLVIGRYGSGEVFSISNTPQHIARWLSTIAPGSVVAMEATGAYHQVLASLAHALQMRVYVLNRARSSTTPRPLASAAKPIRWTLL